MHDTPCTEEMEFEFEDPIPLLTFGGVIKKIREGSQDLILLNVCVQP